MANGLFGGGNGTELDPYLVEDAQDLWAVRGNLSAHYKQIYNIDLNVFNDDGGWTPVGTTSTPFTGVYDGGGFEIRNLWVAGKESASLFGRVNNAKTKNILLLNVLVVSSSSGRMGGLIAIAQNMGEDSIYDCHVKGIINESVQNIFRIGGIVGECYSNFSAINKCTFEGTIYGENSSYTGGIVGEARTSIKNSYAKGKIEITCSGSSAPDRVGGVIGELGADKECSYCYSFMDVNTNGEKVGGLVGSTHGGANIIKSWARGNVKGKNYVGGLVGHLYSTTSRVNMCYSTGKVEGSGSNIGGLVGGASNPAKVTYSVWDIEASGQETSAGGIGKTTAEMKDPQTYIDLGWAIYIKER